MDYTDADADINFGYVENAALAVLSEATSGRSEGNIGFEIGRMLNAFAYPAFLVRSDGAISASNIRSWKEFGSSHATIDELPFKVDSGESVSDLVRGVMENDGVPDKPVIVLKRVNAVNGQQQAALAITYARGNIASALVFVITSKWKIKSLLLLKKQYKLSKAEADVLTSLVEGFSTKEIALQRNRSHETIRAQIQSIREKVGSKNQTELIRATLSISDFESNLDEITSAIKHPHRRQSEVLSRGGRRVELTLMGDYSGDPLLTIANATNYTFNSDIERALFEQGLFVISVCAPGCGGTDPPLEGQTREDCLVTDIETILDQLDVKSVLMLAYNANSPVCYKLVNRTPQRFYHLAHVSAPVPLRFITKIDTQSSWVNGILKAGASSPAMKRVLFKGAMRALATLGAEKYFKLQLSSKPVEAEVVFKPENLLEYDHAISVATQAGIRDAAEDIAQTFDDWTVEVENLPVRITIIHGVEDSLYTIENVRDFFTEFSAKATMVEIQNTGFPIFQSQPEVVSAQLRNIVDRYGCNA